MLLAALAVVSYQIDARLDPEERTLEGTARIELDNPTPAPLDRVYLWLYPNRFAEPPRALSDVNRTWIYPRGFDPGSIMLLGGPPAVLLDHPRAGKRTLAMVALDTPIAPAGRATLDVAFRVRIPARYGPFGCAAGVCTLAAGWYPMVAFLDGAGWNLDAPPARGDIEARVRSPWTTVIGAVVCDRARLEDALDAPIVAYERFYAARRSCAGVDLAYVSRFRPPPPAKARIPYGVENFYEHGLDVACDALEMLRELGLGPTDGRPLTFVEAPLRHEIAQAHGDVVLVSDRAWRILPLERFRRFHSLQVARAIFAALVERRVAAREAERDLAWVPDAVASYLVDLYAVRAHRRREYARDMLRYFAFVPEIDSLIYAPKVAFTTAYFGAVEDADPWRDDLRRFANDQPRGKRVYEKLGDLLEARVVDVMRLAMVEGVPLRRAAERVAGRDMSWFFAQWLGPYPPGDVAIAEVDSEARAGRFVHRVRVVKQGAVEPIVLWARDDDGHEVRLRWEGDGPEHVYEFESGAPLDVVHVDPRERLLERLSGLHDDLRLDNRRPARFKLVWTDLAALLDVTQLAVAFHATFSLRRVYDLRNNAVVGFFRSPVQDYGGVLGYGRSFGVRADENRLTGYGFAAVSAARLNERFALAVAEPARPGTQLQSSVGLGYDDRVWHIDPQRGRSARLSIRPALTLLDEDSTLATYSAVGEATQLVRAAAGHVLAFELSFASAFGDVRVAPQLVGVGLVGYEADELLGRGAAALRFEYRHTFVQGLDWNIAQIHRGRGLGGAIFLGAASLADCEAWPDGWFASDSAFFNAGYSLRAFFDELGVQQALMRVDVGVPLARRRRSCLGREVDPARRQPFGVIVSFAPPF